MADPLWAKLWRPVNNLISNALHPGPHCAESISGFCERLGRGLRSISDGDRGADPRARIQLDGQTGRSTRPNPEPCLQVCKLNRRWESAGRTERVELLLRGTDDGAPRAPKRAAWDLAVARILGARRNHSRSQLVHNWNDQLWSTAPLFRQARFT